jgi:hypothetical protein
MLRIDRTPPDECQTIRLSNPLILHTITSSLPQGKSKPNYDHHPRRLRKLLTKNNNISRRFSFVCDVLLIFVNQSDLGHQEARHWYANIQAKTDHQTSEPSSCITDKYLQ